MKSTNRIRKNADTKAASTQLKTPQEPPVTVIFWSHKKEQELFKMDLPEAFYAAFERTAKETNTRREQLVEQMMAAIIAHHAPPAADNFQPRMELEEAMNQSAALSRLMADFYDHQVSQGFLSPQYADKISAGIAQLTQVTESRMAEAVDRSLAAMMSTTN